MALVSVVVVIIILLIVALISGGSSNKGAKRSSQASAAHRRVHTHHAASTVAANAAPALVALSLRPLATVYVCLIGDGGRRLIPGLELQPGESTHAFHAHRFEINLGNNSVTMVVDGRPLEVPPSTQAIGYTITKAAGRRPLRQPPTCK